MVVRTDTPEVAEAQRAMMEFLLLNHPLDCPICDQAGECGLQDYAFKHGVAFSRFRYEDKRTYPDKERIPLGPRVLLNMNRCIQCTRCIRFTQEISKTGELGFFERGARTEIGVFPGKPLDNELSACVVDVCPVGALTSTQFRFAERVWYLDKKPSLCTGCDVGCNITLEHRRGAIRRYKPRFNPEVNDYWMCDHGRTTFERYTRLPRLATPRIRRNGVVAPAGWKDALDLVARRLKARDATGLAAFLGSPYLTNEEAFLLASLADRAGSPHRAVIPAPGPVRRIPNLKGGVEGRESAPNRRGAELAGLAPGPGAVGFEALVSGDGASPCGVLVVAGSEGLDALDPEAVACLRRSTFLVVAGWADTPLAQAADVALPTATHAEQDGTFVNVQGRLQAFEAAFAPPPQVRPGVKVLSDLLARFDPDWAELSAAAVLDRLAKTRAAFADLSRSTLPATGALLALPEAASR
jgi:NADH-quinone oxidoreductase subunit G